MRPANANTASCKSYRRISSACLRSSTAIVRAHFATIGDEKRHCAASSKATAPSRAPSCVTRKKARGHSAPSGPRYAAGVDAEASTEGWTLMKRSSVGLDESDSSDDALWGATPANGSGSESKPSRCAGGDTSARGSSSNASRRRFGTNFGVSGLSIMVATSRRRSREPRSTTATARHPATRTSLESTSVSSSSSSSSSSETLSTSRVRARAGNPSPVFHPTGHSTVANSTHCATWPGVSLRPSARKSTETSYDAPGKSATGPSSPAPSAEPETLPGGSRSPECRESAGWSQRTRKAPRISGTHTTATISTGATPVLVTVTCLVTNSPAGHSSRSPHSYRERTEAPEERSPRTSFCFSKCRSSHRRMPKSAAGAAPPAPPRRVPALVEMRTPLHSGGAHRSSGGRRSARSTASAIAPERNMREYAGDIADASSADAGGGGGPRRWPARDSSAAVNTPSAASFVFVALASLPMIPSSPAVASTRSAVCTACAGNSAPSGACARGSGAPSRNARRHRASSVAAASRSASAPWLASGRGAFVATIAPRGACLCSSGSSRHTRSSAETAAGGVQGGRCAPPFSFLANWASFGPRFWRGGGTFTLGFRAPLPPSPPRPPSRAGCGAILTRPPPRV